ncbi:MAG: N-acetylmuramoyl-L-alanine amidase [Opitutaceae bacterium]
MFPAAVRLAAVIGILAPALLLAREPAGRVAPTRPESMAPVANSRAATSGKSLALPLTRIGGMEFISLRDLAGQLRWKMAWVQPDHRLALSDSSGRIELTAGSREALVDGLRVFLGNPVILKGGVLYVSKTDYQRCLMPLFRPSLLGPLLARPKVIVIDPGHGGTDNGMENKPMRLKEKVLTLDVALRLRKLLEARGYKVVLTRSDDRQLGPTKLADFINRAVITNRAKADLFVSIHFNSLYPDTKTSGTEVYTFTRAGQRSDHSWGFGSQDDADPTPSEINRFDPWSSLLAHSLHREVIASLKTTDRGQKTMHLAVLRNLKCPGVLVESIFLSNEAEAKRAATPAYLQRIAQALASGIDDYADALEKFSPKPAAIRGVTR